MSANTASGTGLAGRYATALFDLAKNENATDQVADDLTGLAQLAASEPDLQRALSSPTVNREARLQAIEAIGAKAGMNPLTVRFLGVLAGHSRLNQLAEIAEAFRVMVAQSRGEVAVEVSSAVPLDDAQADAVAKAVSASVGRDVVLQQRVDPALLGGLVVRVGSRMIDASLKTKLRHLELAMRGAG